MQVACARNNASIGSVCAAINDAAAGYSELYRRAACTISLTLAFFVNVGGMRQRRLLVSYRSILDPQVLASTTPRGRQLRSAHALLKPQSSVPPAPLPLQEARVQVVPIEPPKGVIRLLPLTIFPVAARTAPSLPTPPRVSTYLREPCEHEYLYYTPARDGEGVVRWCNLEPSEVEEGAGGEGGRNMLSSRSAHSSDLP